MKRAALAHLRVSKAMELLLHNNMAEALPSMVDHHSKAMAHLLSNNTEDSSKGMGDHRQDHHLDKVRADIREGMGLLHQLQDTEVANPHRERRVTHRLIRC